MSTNITLTAGVLPAPQCYASHQEEFNDYVRHTTATLNSGSLKYIVSQTAPGADDQDKLWVQVDSGGNPVRQWIFSGGSWIWPHETPANDKRLVLFYGSSAEIDTLDGGVAGTAAPTSGPFWEIFTDLGAKFPMGVGTLGDGTVVGVTDTGGSERVTLSGSEVPDHGHTGKAYYRASGGSLSSDPSGQADDIKHENSGHTTSASGNFAAAGVLTDTVSGTSGESHDNMPPYYGVYYIKRTVRSYYTA